MQLHIDSINAYYQHYRAAIENPSDFWLSMAHHFQWHQKPHIGLQGDFHNDPISWFADGVLNITENCVDRHLQLNPIAYIAQPNNPDAQAQNLHYSDVYAHMNQLANALKQLGIQKGDRVIIYMPMIPQAVYAALACARIGAIHSIVFAGFSAQALADRMADAQASCVITADFLYRGSKTIEILDIVREAKRLFANTLPTVVWRTQISTSLHAEEYDYETLVSVEAPHC